MFIDQFIVDNLTLGIIILQVVSFYALDYYAGVLEVQPPIPIPNWAFYARFLTGCY